MSDFVFAAALGRAVELADNAGEIGVLILTDAVESDAALRERATVAEIVGANAEATNANYERKTSAVVIGLTGDVASIALANVAWTNVGVGDVWAKLITYVGTVPLTAHDFAVTPNTGGITAQFDNILEVD